MAGRVELKGHIGDGNMAPAVIHIPNGSNGEMREMRTFKMWAEDYTKPTQVDSTTGKKRPARSVVQVVLPNDDRGKKLLEALSPNRKVLIRGRLGHRPAVRENKETGKLIAYPNPTCYMDTMEFLDQDPVYSAEQTLQLLVEKDLLTEDLKASFMMAVKTHIADRKKPVAKVNSSEEMPLGDDTDGLFPEE